MTTTISENTLLIQLLTNTAQTESRAMPDRVTHVQRTIAPKTRTDTNVAVKKTENKKKSKA